MLWAEPLGLRSHGARAAPETGEAALALATSCAPSHRARGRGCRRASRSAPLDCVRMTSRAKRRRNTCERSATRDPTSCRSSTSPTRASNIRRTPSFGSPGRRSAARTSTSTTGSSPTCRVGHTFGHEFTGVVEEMGRDVDNLQRRRPGGGAVQHLLWHLLLLPARTLRQLRDSEPSERPRRRRVRLFAHYRRLRRRSGRVRARPFADVGPMKIPDDMDDE